MARSRSVRFAAPAEADVVEVLATSQRTFGDAARVRYDHLISTALRAIARDPAGLGSKDRANLRAGLRSRHLRVHATSSGVRDPRHVIFYEFDDTHVSVIRVLHEAMDFEAELH